MSIFWPIKSLCPRYISAVPAFATTSGNPSIDGTTQVVSSGAGLWRIFTEGYVLVDPANIKLWRSLEAKAQGRSGQFVYPVFEADRPPLLNVLPESRYTDLTGFSDGTGYRERAYIATVHEGVGLHKTKMKINFASGSPAPQEGQLFSVFNRLYIIKELTTETPTRVAVDFWPTSREEIEAGVEIEFDMPTCMCRLVSDAEMSLESLDRGRRTTATVNFVEDTGARI